MRKREQQPHSYYPDIFEPAPLWRAPITQSNNTSVNTYAQSPTHRSPIHHQPSLNDLLYNFENDSRSTRQEVYSGAYHQHHHHHHSRSADNNNNTYYEEEQQQQDHQVVHYDDVEDDEDEDETVVHHHRQQADNISATSLFTAADHFQEEDDDTSSTENLRHGYLPNQPFSPAASDKKKDILSDFKKKLNLTHTLDWEDYKPQYRQLNDSYANVKKDIYSDIYATLQKMQELDNQFNIIKLEFQLDLEKNYEQMSDHLILQCQELSKEKEEYTKKSKISQGKMQFHHEKIRLNVGGNIFETSLSTLRRDTSSLLATMFSGRHPITTESDGSYFIDRDPSHFRHILNYLRDLRVPPAILQDSKIREELLQEAKYYCVEGLVTTLQQP